MAEIRRTGSEDEVRGYDPHAYDTPDEAVYDPACAQCGHTDEDHWRDDDEEGGCPCHASDCGCGDFYPMGEDQ